MKKRLDQILVDMKVASSRSQAKQLIKSEKIKVQGKLTSKASLIVSEDDVEVLEAQSFVVSNLLIPFLFI